MAKLSYQTQPSKVRYEPVNDEPKKPFYKRGIFWFNIICIITIIVLGIYTFYYENITNYTFISFLGLIALLFVVDITTFTLS